MLLFPVWIALNRLDQRAGDYPVMRLKNLLLLALTPIAVADFVLEFLYFRGIEPDIIVEESANGSSRRVREADLEGHLSNDRDPEAERKAAAEKAAAEGKTPAAGEEEAAQPPRFELAGKDDYQLNQAINLLKGLQIVQNTKQ